MSQLPLAFDFSLLVHDGQGCYVPATADQILEAARYAIDRKIQRGAEFTSPVVVKDYLRTKLAGLEHEVFAVLFLDTRHRLIEYVEMFRGTIDSAAVIVSHNHPSGNPEPSSADMALTRRLKDALALVEVRTLDHIVVGGESTVSFAERGLV